MSKVYRTWNEVKKAFGFHDHVWEKIEGSPIKVCECGAEILEERSMRNF